MDLKGFHSRMQPAIDAELRAVVGSPKLTVFTGLREMLAYQLGWEGDGSGVEAQGKRIRPLLVTLTAEAVGGEWQKALPAAAATELLHNFSLIHDDIEDASLLRRGRPTLWSKWGIALAINAGDAMYALAFEAIHRLEQTIGAEAVFKAGSVLTDTCLQLTGGQHLDISYEDSRDIPLESYWPMVTGKTAALLSACVQLGAICGGADSSTSELLHRFGYSLGLSFQIQDDWLGIWGDEAETGKSKASDLVAGKKSLPILYGLKQGGAFSREWLSRSLGTFDTDHLAELLVEDGAREYTESQAKQYIQEAMSALEQAGLTNDAGQALQELATSLLNRRF
jgi:geranylgeranyl diphosphate synthase type I